MTNNYDTFRDHFYNIQGYTVAERKRHLYNILKKCNLSTDDLQRIATNLKPKNYLETVFHADVLIYFKQTEALLEFLRSGNEPYVSKIIKQTWFIEEVFKDIPVNQLVDKILPTFSFSVKTKVLKRLMKLMSPDEVDELFDHLSNKYGLQFAAKVLAGCSPKKIDFIVRNHNIKFSTNDLKLVFKKDSKLIETYFDQMKHKEFESVCDKNFSLFLAENDSPLFWKILKLHNKPCVKLGKRLTKRLLSHLSKQDIVANLQYHIYSIHRNTTVRVLDRMGLFPAFYKSLFPNYISDVIYTSSLFYILSYSKEKSFDLFKTAFEETYNRELWSNLKFIDYDLVDIIGSKDIRFKWAKAKFSETGEIVYLQYYDVVEGIALMKEKINMTTALSVRTQLLTSLLQCCFNNEDITALGKVLQYFSERHRNEVASVREKFLEYFRQLYREKTDLFNEYVWKYWIEIISIQFFNNEKKFFLNIQILLKYIEFLYTQGRDSQAEKAINLYFSKFFNKYHFSSGLGYLKNVDIKKKILLYTYNHFKNIKEEQEDDFSCIIISFIEYNIKHRKCKIVFDEEMQILTKNALNGKHSEFLIQSMCPALCNNDLEDFELKLLEILLTSDYEKLFSIFSLNREVIKFFGYYLTHNPALVIPYFDKLLNKLLDSYVTTEFWRTFRYISHLNLHESIKKCCLEKLNDSSKDHKNCFRLLSYVLNTEDYILFAKNYLSECSKKMEDPSQAPTIKMEKICIKLLSNTPDPSKYWSLIFGDLRRSLWRASLSPLYKAFSKLPENSVAQYHKRIMQEKNLLFSKQAVVLACNFLDQNTVLQTLKSFPVTTNRSVKKTVFKRALKYFSKNAIDELSEIVFILMKNLNDKDLDSLKILFSVDIDSGYKEEYFLTAWALLESFQNNQDIDAVKVSSLQSFNHLSFHNLPDNFCKEIIQKYFLAHEKSEEIDKFVANYLIAGNKDENFNFVFQIISNFKLKYWSDCKVSNRNVIKKFITAFVMVVHKNKIELNVIEKFLKNWESIFAPSDYFEDYLILQFTKFWKLSVDISDFALRIVEYLEQVVNQYEHVFSDFAKALAEFLTLEGEKEGLEVFLAILKSPMQYLSCLLVIELIKSNNDFLCKGEMATKYSTIDTQLKQKLDNKLILLKYTSLLNSVCSDDDDSENSLFKRSRFSQRE